MIEKTLVARFWDRDRDVRAAAIQTFLVCTKVWAQAESAHGVAALEDHMDVLEMILLRLQKCNCDVREEVRCLTFC